MSLKIMSLTSGMAACAAGAAILFAPGAAAQDPNDCTSVASATVCNSNMPPPPANGADGGGPGGANNQNGEYGPAGDAPPVGNG
jgi:hypothetical protein